MGCWVKLKCILLIYYTIPSCNNSTDQGDVEIFRTTLCLPSIISCWSFLSGQLLQHVLSLRYSSGMGCISCLDTLTQTLDIKEHREDIRFNVIQTNSESFYFSLMSVAASTRSPQKYVNIFFSKGQIFNLSPPIFDMTVEVWCQVYTVKINESILCLTAFAFFESKSVRGQSWYNDAVGHEQWGSNENDKIFWMSELFYQCWMVGLQ